MTSKGEKSSTGLLLQMTKAIMFFDYLGVALVVPLLSSYFRDAGVDKMMYAYISSTYAISQLVGGVAIGAASDSLSKKSILLLSFIGSAISYTMVSMTSNVYLLFGSRVLVGLVKQTMTVTTSTISELTAGNPELRTRELGQCSAAATFSFVVGPGMGSYMYKRDPRLPCLCAAVLFLLNITITMVFFPSSFDFDKKKSDKEKKIEEKKSLDDSIREEKKTGLLAPAVNAIRNFFRSVVDLCQNPAVGYIVALQVFYGFVVNSMSYRHILNYMEDRFGIETYQLGFLSSYGSIAGIASDIVLVPVVMKFFDTAKKPYSTITVCLLLIAVANLGEVMSPTLNHYVFYSMLPNVVASNLLASSMKNAFLTAVPVSDTGKAQGIMGMLSSFSGIVAPIYGTSVQTRVAGTQMGAVTLQRPHFAALHFVLIAIISGVGGAATSGVKSKRE